MKTVRQEKILEIITKYEVETQEDLIERLREEGYNVTQATVSRDIREMKLTKVLTGRGVYRYVRTGSAEGSGNVRFNNALVDSIKKVSYACNMVVVKTYPGLASAVAAGLDSVNMEEMLGCVAGDDTIMIVAQNDASAAEISEKIKNMMKTI